MHETPLLKREFFLSLESTPKAHSTTHGHLGKSHLLMNRTISIETRESLDPNVAIWNALP